MITYVIYLVEQYVAPMGWLGVFLAEVIEEVIVPIPSSVILLGSGFTFLKGPLSPSLLWTLIFTVAIPAAVGLTVGSFVIYAFAYKGGKIFLDKYGKWIGVTWADIEDMNSKFKSGVLDEWSIVIARVFPVIPSVLIAVFCGFIRMPYKKYLMLTLIGAFFKAILLAIIGWQVGRFYLQYAGVISRVENTVFVLIVISIGVFVVYRKSKLKMIQ